MPPALSARAAEARTSSRAAAVLAFLRLEYPALLPPPPPQPLQHPLVPRVAPPKPSVVLSNALADGAALASVIASIDSTALPAHAIRRAARGVSAPAGALSAVRPADVAQVYKANVRRVRAGVLGILGGGVRPALEEVFRKGVEEVPWAGVAGVLGVAEVVLGVAFMGEKAEEFVWGAARMEDPCVRVEICQIVRESAVVFGVGKRAREALEGVLGGIATESVVRVAKAQAAGLTGEGGFRREERMAIEAEGEEDAEVPFWLGSESGSEEKIDRERGRGAAAGRRLSDASEGGGIEAETVRRRDGYSGSGLSSPAVGASVAAGAAAVAFTAAAEARAAAATAATAAAVANGTSLVTEAAASKPADARVSIRASSATSLQPPGVLVAEERPYEAEATSSAAPACRPAGIQLDSDAGASDGVLSRTGSARSSYRRPTSQASMSYGPEYVDGGFLGGGSFAFGSETGGSDAYSTPPSWMMGEGSVSYPGSRQNSGSLASFAGSSPHSGAFAPISIGSGSLAGSGGGEGGGLAGTAGTVSSGDSSAPSWMNNIDSESQATSQVASLRYSGSQRGSHRGSYRGSYRNDCPTGSMAGASDAFSSGGPPSWMIGAGGSPSLTASSCRERDVSWNLGSVSSDGRSAFLELSLNDEAQSSLQRSDAVSPPDTSLKKKISLFQSADTKDVERARLAKLRPAGPFSPPGSPRRQQQDFEHSLSESASLGIGGEQGEIGLDAALEGVHSLEGPGTSSSRPTVSTRRGSSPSSLDNGDRGGLSSTNFPASGVGGSADAAQRRGFDQLSSEAERGGAVESHVVEEDLGGDSLAAPIVAVARERFARSDDMEAPPPGPVPSRSALAQGDAIAVESGFDGRKLSMVTNDTQGRTPLSSPMPQDSPHAGAYALEEALLEEQRRQRTSSIESSRDSSAGTVTTARAGIGAGSLQSPSNSFHGQSEAKAVDSNDRIGDSARGAGSSDSGVANVVGTASSPDMHSPAAQLLQRDGTPGGEVQQPVVGKIIGDSEVYETLRRQRERLAQQDARIEENRRASQYWSSTIAARRFSDERAASLSARAQSQGHAGMQYPHCRSAPNVLAARQGYGYRQSDGRRPEVRQWSSRSGGGHERSTGTRSESGSDGGVHGQYHVQSRDQSQQSGNPSVVDVKETVMTRSDHLPSAASSQVVHANETESNFAAVDGSRERGAVASGPVFLDPKPIGSEENDSFSVDSAPQPSPARLAVPPSPPAVDDLLISLSDSGSSAGATKRPISTMAPSDGLFTRLVDVYRSSHSSHSVVSGAQAQSSIRSRRGGVRLSGVSVQSLERDGGDERSEANSPGPSRGGENPIVRVSRPSKSGDSPQWMYSEPDVRSQDWDDVLSGSGAGDRDALPAKVGSVSETADDEFVPPDSAVAMRESKFSSDGTSSSDRIHINRNSLDWLTQELLAARDVVHQKDVELSLANRAAQDNADVLSVEKKDVGSFVSAMKQMLHERESELNDARSRLASTIQDTAEDAEEQERLLALVQKNSRARRQEKAEQSAGESGPSSSEKAASRNGHSVTGVVTESAGIGDGQRRGHPSGDEAGVLSESKLVSAGNESFEFRDSDRANSLSDRGSGVRASESGRVSVKVGSKASSLVGRGERMGSSRSGDSGMVTSSRSSVSSVGKGVVGVSSRVRGVDVVHGNGSSYDVSEMREMWSTVRQDIEGKVLVMLDRRDEELSALRQELVNRDRAVEELHRVKDKQDAEHKSFVAESSTARLSSLQQSAQSQVELAEMRGQVLCVTRFSKKLEDMYLETEQLRVQVAESRAKMAAVASSSGIGSREAKDLRDAAMLAQADADRWKSQAAQARENEDRANRRAADAERLFHSSQGVASHHPLPEAELDTAPEGDERVERAERPGRAERTERAERTGRRDSEGHDDNTARRRKRQPRPDEGRRAAERLPAGSSSGESESPWLQIREKVTGIITGAGKPAGYSAMLGPRRGVLGSNRAPRGREGPRQRSRPDGRFPGDHRPRPSNQKGSNAWSGVPRDGRPPRYTPAYTDNSAAEAVLARARQTRSGGAISASSSGMGAIRGRGGRGNLGMTQFGPAPNLYPGYRGGTPLAPYVQGAHGQAAYGYSAFGRQRPRVGDF